jgi:hypothetical protein
VDGAASRSRSLWGVSSRRGGHRRHLGALARSFSALGNFAHDGVSPLNLVLTLPLGTVAAGLILGWIWLRTQSIWLVSIAHGALNDWGQYAFKYMKETGEPQTDLLLSAGSLALLIVGALLWRDADVSPVCKTTSGGERS